jgi:hypothetical protein
MTLHGEATLSIAHPTPTRANSGFADANQGQNSQSSPNHIPGTFSGGYKSSDCERESPMGVSTPITLADMPTPVLQAVPKDAILRQSNHIQAIPSPDRYGELEEEEQQILLTKLSNYKQQRTTPIADHCTRWENLLHQLISPIPEKRKVQLFVMSLFDVGLKMVIYTSYADSLASAIDAAIRIVRECQLESPTTNNEINSDPFDWQLRLYNRQGHPICGFCGAQHRSIKCQTTEAHQFWQTKGRKVIQS